MCVYLYFGVLGPYTGGFRVWDVKGSGQSIYCFGTWRRAGRCRLYQCFEKMSSQAPSENDIQELRCYVS